jgi:hypothetical protein
MKRESKKRLQLVVETVRAIHTADLTHVVGGVASRYQNSCVQVQTCPGKDSVSCPV